MTKEQLSIKIHELETTVRQVSTENTKLANQVRSLVLGVLGKSYTTTISCCDRAYDLEIDVNNALKSLAQEDTRVKSLKEAIKLILSA